MNAALDLFYFLMFGGGVLAPLLLGAVWLAVKALKIPPGRLRRGLYQGAVVAALLIAFAAFEWLTRSA